MESDHIYLFVQQAIEAFEASGNPVLKAHAERLETLDYEPVEVATNWLDSCDHVDMAVPADETRSVFQSLQSVVELLPWKEAPQDLTPECFAGRHAFTEIVGPTGVWQADDFRFGAFVIDPDTYYPFHKHGADEFYFYIAGSAQSSVLPQRDHPYQAGDVMVVPSHTPHDTRTGAEPVVVLWGWWGTVSWDDYAFCDGD